MGIKLWKCRKWIEIFKNISVDGGLSEIVGNLASKHPRWRHPWLRPPSIMHPRVHRKKYHNNMQYNINYKTRTWQNLISNMLPNSMILLNLYRNHLSIFVSSYRWSIEYPDRSAAHKNRIRLSEGSRNSCDKKIHQWVRENFENE